MPGEIMAKITAKGCYGRHVARIVRSEMRGSIECDAYGC
jgi:hypothetical protein